MAEPFLGEIRCFSFPFAPKDWAFCDGTILQISENQALYALLGTTYGGNGTTTFALPDLRGRAPVHFGNGITLGEKAGEETHTLTVNEMPAHTHMAQASSSNADQTSAEGHVWAINPTIANYASQADQLMSTNALASAGSSQAHSNMQPYNVANFCIALKGIFPSRS
ncbi:tail fiber protein [Bacillus tianshenii]|nr:tail fiber protein [Bacillus tianshenii]